MSFDWEKAAEGGRAPKIPAGQTRIKIIRVMTTEKGNPILSTNKDPQIRVIFADAQGNEAMQTYTLSEKAGFKIAQVLRASGANLTRLNEAGVQLEHFADQDWATKHLVERKLLADITYDDKGYADIAPLMPQPGQQPAAQLPAPQAAPQAAPPPRQAPRQPMGATVGAAAGGGFNPEGDFKEADIPF